MRDRSRHAVAAVLVLATLGVSGCAGATTTTGSAATESTAPSTSVLTATSPAPAAKRPAQRSHPGHPPHRTPPSHSSTSLAYATASNDVVQPQLAPGSCHAVGTGLYSRPDPACTPGALNRAVTQATIDQTICVTGWTATVRPPESVTESEKAASMAAYGDTDSLSAYEYDHFVPLELGGATNDPRNLWPEPGASPNPKDTVENALRREVCAGQITLATAQHEIATNWVRFAQPSSAPPSASPSASAPAHGAECTLSASYSSAYHDYNVYVHSNQPDQSVTVTDAEGHTDSWHTDTSGYADVYFKSGGYAPGRRITAQVGQASCSATL